MHPYTSDAQVCSHIPFLHGSADFLLLVPRFASVNLELDPSNQLWTADTDVVDACATRALQRGAR